MLGGLTPVGGSDVLNILPAMAGGEGSGFVRATDVPY